VDGEQAVSASPKEGNAPKRKYPSGWAKKKAKREKQRQLILATLTAAGRERVAEVLPPAQVPQTLADVARELRRVFWESRMRLIPDDVASHQAYTGMQALRATELEVQTSQIAEYLQRMKEPRQPLVVAYKYGTDEPVEAQP
jgi:hypothetical protein